LLLFNIGDNEVTAGELKTRGYYQGSNVSYNLKRFVIYIKKGWGIYRMNSGMARGPRGEVVEGSRYIRCSDF